MMHPAALAEPAGVPMPGTAGDGALELMLPQDLPMDLVLEPGEAARLRRIIAGLLAALADADADHRATRLRALLEELGDSGGRATAAGATGIPADTAQVQDFDRYFNVRRVAGAAPATGLLRSLLQTATAVMSLCARGGDLPQAQVQGQIRGIAAHARLLARIFGIGDLP